MDNASPQRKRFFTQLLTALLAVVILSPLVQALDITGDTNTSDIAQNLVLDFTTSATLTADNNYSANGLNLNNQNVTLDTTTSGNTLDSFSTYGNGSLTTRGSGSISLGSMSTIFQMAHVGTGGLSFSSNNAAISELYLNSSDTITCTAGDSLAITTLYIKADTTLDCRNTRVRVDTLDLLTGKTLKFISNDTTTSINGINGENGTLNILGGACELNGSLNELNVTGEALIYPANIFCYILDIDANTTISHGGKDITVMTRTEIANDTTLTIQNSGTSKLSTIDLSGTLINNTSGTTITTINAVSEGNAKLDGTGTATVSNLVTLNNNLQISGSGAYTFNAGVAISSDKTLTINGSGAHVLKNVDLAGTLTNNDGSLNQLTSLTINSGDTAIVSGSEATAVDTANINGTLNYNATANVTYTTANIAGTLNQNSNNVLTLATLNIENAKTAIINLNDGAISLATVNNNGTFNTTIASGATINLGMSTNLNEVNLAGTLSSNSTQTITTLNINESDTGLISGSGSGTITVTTANINGTHNYSANANSTYATVNLTGTLNQKSTKILTLTNLNVSSGNAKLAGNGATTITNQLVLNNNFEIAGDGVKTFSGGVAVNSGSTLTIKDLAAHVLNDVTLAGTLENNDANLSKLDSLTISSGDTGIVSGTNGTSAATANINGTHTYSATADTTYDTAHIAGTLNQDSVNTLTMTNLNVAGGNTATMNVNAGILAVDNITNSGTMNITIAKSGRLVNNNASAIDLSANNSTMTLDFGDDSDTTVYATTSGVIKSAGTATDGEDTITSVYAINGVKGTTYANVFTTISDGTNNFGDDDLLNTNDRLRKYVICNGGTGVTVFTDTDRISSEIRDNGGSAQTAGGLVKMVENQGSMNAADSAYITALTQLEGAALTLATQETMGQEATTGTAQSALQGVLGSTGAVGNQLNSFRSGGIAVGMTSFSSGGATAALSDMADADTLSEAYDTGFTSASDSITYNKVQVWANGYGNFGEQGSVGEMTGYDFHNFGTMVGVDYAFSQELRIGALFGYSYNKATVYQNLGGSTDNTMRLGAYSSFSWDNFFADLSSSVGIHLIDSTRNIWNGTVAKSDRTGIDFNLNGTIGYTFNLPADIQLTPTYSLNYTMLYDPKFTETGAGSANIDYDSFTSNSLIQDIGVKTGKIFRVNDKLAFLPEAWSGWEVEYLNTGGTRNTASVGQNFQTTLNGMATNRAYWGAGMTALINDNISVYSRYDHKIWNKGYNIGFTAGIKVSF